MSATTIWPRATTPHIPFRSTRCLRLMSTEAVPVKSAYQPPVATRARAPKPKHSLAERIHRSLYPSFYEGPNPKIAKKKRWIKPKKIRAIGEKWKPMMSERGVSKGLSTQFGIPIFQPSAHNIKKTCPDAIAAVAASQTSILDPKGARTRLFSRENPERACVGDVLLVRQRTGDPFAGVCINIRRQGIDTAILLRGQLTRVGVEMWFKIYSPLVEGIEVVQRAQRKVRRARLMYMRQVRHDRGSVENVVRIYLRQKAALGSVETKKKTGAEKQAAMMQGKKKQKGRGRKR